MGITISGVILFLSAVIVVGIDIDIVIGIVAVGVGVVLDIDVGFNNSIFGIISGDDVNVFILLIHVVDFVACRLASVKVINWFRYKTYINGGG